MYMYVHTYKFRGGRTRPDPRNPLDPSGSESDPNPIRPGPTRPDLTRFLLKSQTDPTRPTRTRTRPDPTRPIATSTYNHNLCRALLYVGGENNLSYIYVFELLVLFAWYAHHQELYI
jgi:hypothetical protein